MCDTPGWRKPSGSEFYLPEGLYPQAAITLMLRTERDPMPLFREVRQKIVDIDKDAFVFDVKPMNELIADSLAPRRFSTILLSAFAIVALMLSLAGIYAVIAHSVAQRTVEIGIRTAMGASAASITTLMLRYGLTPAMFGMVLGWSGAVAISRFFRRCCSRSDRSTFRHGSSCPPPCWRWRSSPVTCRPAARAALILWWPCGPNEDGPPVAERPDRD